MMRGRHLFIAAAALGCTPALGCSAFDESAYGGGSTGTTTATTTADGPTPDGGPDDGPMPTTGQDTTAAASTADADTADSSESDTVADDDSSSTGEPFEDSLRYAGAQHGIVVGAAVATGPLADDPAYIGILEDEFNLLTPENAGKWGPLQPTADTWDFAELDAIVDFAEANGQAVKGHALLWYFQTPDWVTDAMSPAEFATAVNNHIDETVGRYADRIWSWDVVNEAIADDLTGAETPTQRLRQSIYTDKLGPDYIADAFIRARAADPNAVLVYNDYGIIGPGAKADAVYELLSGLVADGVPIDAIGFQSHLRLARLPGPESVAANFQRFADLGLAIHLSEMDVRTASLGGEPADRLEAQSLAFQLAVEACVAQPACDTISFWGVTDNYSWLNQPDSPESPLPFDGNGARKPGYDGIRAAFEGEFLTVGEDQIENGDFELGSAGWGALGGTFSVEPGVGVGGSMGGQLTDRTETWMGPSQPLFAQFDPWTTWSVRVSGQVSAGTQRLNLTLRIGENGPDAQYIGLQSLYAGTEFTNMGVAFTVPAEGFNDSVLMYVEGPATGVDMVLDNVEVRQLSTRR